MRSMGWTIAVIGTIMLLGWAGYRGIAYVNFERLCEGFLKNAADANSIEDAEKRLAIAVQYIREHKLDSGFTSVLWRTPDADMGFWAGNLTNALEELRALSGAESSVLEQSNMLMKLKETLLDDTSSGVSVTAPEGISIFPHNAGLCWLSIISVVIMTVGFIMVNYSHHSCGSVGLRSRAGRA